MAAELISIICMSILYGLIGYKLLRIKQAKCAQKLTKHCQTTNITKMTQEAGVSSRKTKTISGKQYSLMFMSISFVSILCFFPPWICIILETKNKSFWDHLTYEESQAFVIMRGFFVLNFVVNPFIYGFFDSKFRQNVKIIFSINR